jgi:prolyl-tRNA synthetase
VKKGAPIIVEVGPRDVADGKAAVLRRDRLYKDDGKLALHAEAKARLDGAIARDVTDLAKHFKGSEDKVVGWAEVQWARPSGAVLDGIVARLKELKLTMRNTPLDAAPADGVCFFTGEKAVERILIGRTY